MPIDISFKTASNVAATTYINLYQNYINVEGDALQGDLDLNNHKIMNVGMSTADKDCASKGYIDQQINDTHNILSRIDKCIKSSMLTIKFDLSRMVPSTVHRLGYR